MLLEGGATIESRLTHGFRLITARTPRPNEMTILKKSLERSLVEFQADPASAASLLKVGEATTDDTINVVELAAYTSLASTMLNLDETVTKE
jgi:hypothetical protein